MAYLNGNKILFGAPMTLNSDGSYKQGYNVGKSDGIQEVLESSDLLKGSIDNNFLSKNGETLLIHNISRFNQGISFFLESEKKTLSCFEVSNITDAGDLVIDTAKNTISMTTSGVCQYADQTWAEICPDIKAGDTVKIIYTYNSQNTGLYAGDNQIVWSGGTLPKNITFTQAMLDSKFGLGGDSMLTVTNLQVLLETDEPAIPNNIQPEIKLYGKNIADLDKAIEEITNISLSKTESGTYKLTRITGSTGIYSGWVDCYIPAGTQFTVSLKIINNSLTNTRILFQYATENKTPIAYSNIDIKSTYTSVTIQATENIYYFRLYMLVGETVGNYIEFNEFQIELYNQCTSYEEYIKPITFKGYMDSNATVSANTVTGFYPCTTVIPITKGLIINDVNYYKDINKIYAFSPIDIALSGGE